MPRHRKWLARYTICAVLLLAAGSAAASSAAEHGLLVWPRHPVYDLLQRFETLGHIRHTGLAARPLSRADVLRLLDEASTAELRPADRDLLQWYRDELAPAPRGWNQAPDGNRATYADERGTFSIGPSLALQIDQNGGDRTMWRFLGAETFGTVGSWFSFHGRAYEIAQTGDAARPAPERSPRRALTGWTRTDDLTEYTYDPSEGYISLSNSWAGLWWGIIPQSTGPGRRGQIFISDKAPATAGLVFRVRPWSWVSYEFNYRQLESGVIDTSSRVRVHDAYTFNRYYRKHLVTQRIEAYAGGFARFSVFQSAVYGATDVDPGYLVPFVNLRYVQHAKDDRDNVQIGADATVWWPKHTAFHASLLIDELKMSTVFDEKLNRNWVAVQAGVRVADVWGLVPGTMLYAEYTRLNPYVYDHKYPWSTFTTAGTGYGGAVYHYPLGHWLGQNSDGLYTEMSYRVNASLDLTAWAEYTRQGPPAPTVNAYSRDYVAVPFLSVDPVVKTTRARFVAKWRTWRHLTVTAAAGRDAVDNGASENGEWVGSLAVSVAGW